MGRRRVCVFAATLHLVPPRAGMRDYPLAGRQEGGLPGARMVDCREDGTDSEGDAAGTIEVGAAASHDPKGDTADAEDTARDD